MDETISFMNLWTRHTPLPLQLVLLITLFQSLLATVHCILTVSSLCNNTYVADNFSLDLPKFGAIRMYMLGYFCTQLLSQDSLLNKHCL